MRLRSTLLAHTDVFNPLPAAAWSNVRRSLAVRRTPSIVALTSGAAFFFMAKPYHVVKRSVNGDMRTPSRDVFHHNLLAVEFKNQVHGLTTIQYLIASAANRISAH